MAPKRRKQERPSRRAHYVIIAVILALVAGMTAVILKLYDPGWLQWPPPRDPAEEAALLLKISVSELGSEHLEGMGRLAYKHDSPAGSKAFHKIGWQAESDTALILAEKSLESVWREALPEVSIMVEYPGGETERVIAMTASLDTTPLLDAVLFYKGDRPEPPPESPGKNLAIPDKKKPHGKIAIIIDDIGNEIESLYDLLDIGVTMTYSVLPYSEHAADACTIIEANNAHAMMHMPMEPESYPDTDPGRGALLTGMSDREIKEAARQALAMVPCARGANNHMGSRMSADRDAMSAFLSVIRDQGMFYVDSRTTVDTVAFITAQRMGVPAAERRVFLDHEQTEEAVRKSLVKLALKADEEGIAIAIGHPHPVTIKVLSEDLPRLRKMGYEFITAEEAVQ